MESQEAILLIEDDVDDRQLTQHALRRANINNEVVFAFDGEAAMAHLFDDSKPLPTVILLDLHLPKLSGLEVLQRIRNSERTRLLPVVILTASDDLSQVPEAYALGANSFIKKPTDPAEFSEMVLQVGMYWLLLNKGPSSLRNVGGNV